MSAADSHDWHHTSPLAAIFYLGKVYQDIAKNAVQSFAPLVAFVYAFEGDLIGKIVVGVGAFVAITIVLSIVRWWFFRYCIEQDSILVREGVLKKIQLDIKFDRIQAINTQQNFVFRYFDLVTVRFDTAGSSKQEGNLPAVTSELAESLRQRIRSKSTDASAEQTEEESSELPTSAILTLSGKDMVRIGLSSNRALVFLAFLAPLINNLMEDIEERVDDETVVAAVDGAQVGVASGSAIVILIVFGFLLLLAVASIVGAFLRYHGYTLVTDHDLFRSTGGLITRHEHSVNFAKIQSLLLSQNLVMRLFARFRVRAKQASSGQKSRDKHFVIPLCDQRQLQDISQEVFAGELRHVDLSPAGASFAPVSARYLRSRVTIFGIMPAVALMTLFMTLGSGIKSVVFLAWIIPVTLIFWIIYRKYGYRVSADGVVLRRGFLGYRVSAFLHRKVQRISLTQSVPQKRHGLATVRFYLASGSLKLPYVDVRLARVLRDYVLYKVESSRLAWH